MVAWFQVLLHHGLPMKPIFDPIHSHRLTKGLWLLSLASVWQGLHQQ